MLMLLSIWMVGWYDQFQRGRDVSPLLQPSSLPFVSDEFEKKTILGKRNNPVYNGGHWPPFTETLTLANSNSSNNILPFSHFNFKKCCRVSVEPRGVVAC